jgi:hypothetical protein
MAPAAQADEARMAKVRSSEAFFMKTSRSTVGESAVAHAA